jgi:hypothetical protein
MEEKDYSINTGFVFQQLQSKWEDFDKEFIEINFHIALHETLRDSNIRDYVGKPNDPKILDYDEQSRRTGMLIEKNKNMFPLHDFGYIDDVNYYVSVVSYYTDYAIPKEDKYFDLFFALQLYLTGTMNQNKFLQFHLKNTFSNEIEEFKYYIERLLYVYSSFLGKQKKIIRLFFKNHKTQNTSEVITALPIIHSHESYKSISTIDFNSELEGIERLENKFCRVLSMKMVINHFIVLTKNKNRNSNYYLTQEQFVCFLRKAFLAENEIEKIRIDVGNREKGVIKYLFYRFYEEAMSIESASPNRDDYIRLLSDNFHYWPFESTKANFNKKPKRHF